MYKYESITTYSFHIIWMFRLSQCLQKRYLKNKVPVSIFAVFTMGRFYAEHDCTGFFSYISVLYSNSSNVFFFPKDLTDGGAPRFEKVSLETKYNIVVGTQTALKPTLLDGLHKLTPEQVWRWADWGFSAAGGHWRHSLMTFSCVWVNRWTGQWGPLKHWSYKWWIMMLGQSLIFKMVLFFFFFLSARKHVNELAHQQFGLPSKSVV